MKTERKHQSFIEGTTILVAATVLVKIIGALFRIPLGSLIGGTGMGYFSKAYDLYSLFYAISVAGLPIAVSRIVAERVAQKRFKDVFKTLRIAQRLFFIVGLVATVIFAVVVIFFVDHDGGVLSMTCIIPLVIICCFMSSYRGFYEGLRNMYPTAISSVIEALVKLLLGLGLAYFVIFKATAEYNALGTVFGNAVEVPVGASDEVIKSAIADAASPIASAVAVFSITLGSLLAMVFLIFYHRIRGPRILREEIALSPRTISGKDTAISLIKIAVPITLASLVTAITAPIDLFTVQTSLESAIDKSPETFMTMYDGLLPVGVTLEDMSKVPTYLYGCYKGFGYSIFNLIPSITSMVGVGVLPVLATAWVERNKPEIKSNINAMMKISALFSMPCGIGVSVMAKPLLELLYSSKTASEIEVTAPLLTILGIAALFTGMTTPMTNLLQAIGKQNIPVINIGIGAVIKLILNLILVSIPGINIKGAAFGTLALYVFHFIASYIAIVKYSGVKINFVSSLLKPFISALACGGAALGVASMLPRFISSGKIVTVLSIAAAGIVYLVVLLLIKGITAEDMKMVPKGDKIAKLLKLK